MVDYTYVTPYFEKSVTNAERFQLIFTFYDLTCFESVCDIYNVNITNAENAYPTCDITGKLKCYKDFNPADILGTKVVIQYKSDLEATIFAGIITTVNIVQETLDTVTVELSLTGTYDYEPSLMDFATSNNLLKPGVFEALYPDVTDYFDINETLLNLLPVSYRILPIQDNNTKSYYLWSNDCNNYQNAFTVYNACDIIELSASAASLNDITTKVDVTFQYSWPLLIQRDYVLYYAGMPNTLTRVVDFHKFIAYMRFVPTAPVQSVYDAATSLGLNLTHFSYSPIPKSIPATPADGEELSYFNAPNYLEFAASAHIEGSKRWSQNVVETYTTTLSVNGSPDIPNQVDRNLKKLSFKYVIKTDDYADWLNEKCYDKDFSRKYTLNNGDSYFKLPDQVLYTLNDAYQFSVQAGYTELLRANRKNTITVKLPIDLYKVIASVGSVIHFNTSVLTGRAQIQSKTLHFDFSTAQATTEYTTVYVKHASNADFFPPDIPALDITDSYNAVEADNEFVYYNTIYQVQDDTSSKPNFKLCKDELNVTDLVTLKGIRRVTNLYDDLQTGNDISIPSSSSLGDRFTVEIISKQSAEQALGFVMQEKMDPRFEYGAVSAYKFSMAVPDVDKSSTDGVELELYDELEVDMCGHEVNFHCSSADSPYSSDSTDSTDSSDSSDSSDTVYISIIDD